MEKNGGQSKKVPGNQAGQRHMKKKARNTGTHKRTMGMGKVEPKANGAMGKNQRTGDGGASDFSG